MISEGSVREGVQLARVDVGLELPIPLGGIKGREPPPELG